MRPALDVELEHRGFVAVLRLNGEFDLGGALSFDARLQQALEHEPESVLVDLRGLTFLDSTGLRALIRADARARREGWNLALTRAARAVERIFELTRTDRRFRIFEDVNGDLNLTERAPSWETPEVTDLAKSEVRPARFSR